VNAVGGTPWDQPVVAGPIPGRVERCGQAPAGLAEATRCDGPNQRCDRTRRRSRRRSNIDPQESLTYRNLLPADSASRDQVVGGLLMLDRAVPWAESCRVIEGSS